MHDYLYIQSSKQILWVLKQANSFETIFVKKLHTNSWGLEILVWFMCQYLCYFFFESYFGVSNKRIVWNKRTAAGYFSKNKKKLTGLS